MGTYRVERNSEGFDDSEMSELVSGETPGYGVIRAGNDNLFRLVEAAGVEPASEKARHAKPTCVSGSGISMRA